MRALDKRIPTLAAIVLLVIGVVITSILVQQKIIIFQNAAPSDVPTDIRITNISDTSFTLTYKTSASVIGTMSLTKSGENPQTILDDRDEQSGVPKAYMLHSISAKDLTPNTSYEFRILSGATTYLNNGEPFSLTTAQTLSNTPSDQIPFAGKVLEPDGTLPSEALVFVTTDNGQLLSTLVNTSGLYILPLNTMRTKDLSAPIQFSDNSVLHILAIDPTVTSHVTIGMQGINPVPPITLSQDYDFTISRVPLATSSGTLNFPVMQFTNTTLQATPQIITPKNNESFTDQQPQFNGTAAPNSTVSISIHSNTAITAQVTTDATGNWTYRPTSTLAPGQHTITVTTADQFGILHKLVQSFIVYAAGSQITSATPSATLAPPTPTPTIAFNPTPTPTLMPTQIPTPTIAQAIISSRPTPRATLPPTGSNTIAIAGIAGVATTVIGIVLFFVTSGATL